MSNIADASDFQAVLAAINSGVNSKIGDLVSLKTFLVEVDPADFT